MNETTNLNTELLSADARGRKHIPFAIFAVIVVHIILFLFLLFAAGCRAKARARRSAPPAAAMVTPQPAAGTKAIGPAVETAKTPRASLGESTPEPAASTRSLQTASNNDLPSVEPTEGERAKVQVYTVKAGDTVEKIARMHRTSVEAIKAENNLKNHLIWPGQKLRVNTESPKSSNEA